MTEARASSRRRWALFALFALLAWFSWTVRAVLNPILLAYLLAYVLNPLVGRLERRGFGRGAAVAVIFGLFALSLLVGTIAVTLQAQQLWQDMNQQGGVIDQLDERLRAGVEAGYQALERWGWIEKVEVDTGARPSLRELAEQLRGLWTADVDLRGAGKVGIQAAGGVLAFAHGVFGSLFSMLTLFLLLPIYTYFLLFQLDQIHGFVIRYVPARRRDKVVSISRQIGEVLSAFLRGRLMVSLIKGAIIALGLWLIGVPYALLLGLFAGLFSLIPVVGPLAAFLLGFGLALLSFDVYEALWRACLVYLLAEVIEGYVLVPKILGDSLGMHPVVVLVSLMIGGAFLGMFGLLIALPFAATLIILMREIVLPALARESDAPR